MCASLGIKRGIEDEVILMNDEKANPSAPWLRLESIEMGSGPCHNDFHRRIAGSTHVAEPVSPRGGRDPRS
jgi:hypothetical protein